MAGTQSTSTISTSNTNTRQYTNTNPILNTWQNANTIPTLNIHLVPNSNDQNHPHYIGGNDILGAILITGVLDSTNFYAWARSMK